MKWRSVGLWGVGWAVLSLSGVAAPAQVSGPEALRQRIEALERRPVGKLADRALYLQTTDVGQRMTSDIHAVIDLPYGLLRKELSSVDRWCNVLILHLGVKYCRATGKDGDAALILGVGRKDDQPLEDLYWGRFAFKLRSSTDGFYQLTLQAPKGPMGTSDYRVVIEAAPAGERQTAFHFSYAYSYGLPVRWAVQAYLATLGRDKRGFTVVGQRADGSPELVRGVPGMLERNAMRYFLAIDAYLGAAEADGGAAQRARKALEDHFDATERYARQLHEVDRAAYLATKVKEIRRQETVDPPDGALRDE